MTDLAPEERLALIRFVEEYAPDMNLIEDGWTKVDIAWLDTAYDHLHDEGGIRPEGTNA